VATRRGNGWWGMTASEHTGFCVRCKAKRQFHGTLGATQKGQPFAKGPCSTCGTSMVTFIRKGSK
jgi:Domain of unknown function (DUF5679)